MSETLDRYVYACGRRWATYRCDGPGCDAREPAVPVRLQVPVFPPGDLRHLDCDLCAACDEGGPRHDLTVAMVADQLGPPPPGVEPPSSGVPAPRDHAEAHR